MPISSGCMHLNASINWSLSIDLLIKLADGVFVLVYKTSTTFALTEIFKSKKICGSLLDSREFWKA